MRISKVLIVDDDDNIRMIAQIGLEDRGDWQIIEARSGEEALSTAARERPDVILLDMMMPGMDGISAYGKLKDQAETADIPVIFMTAKVQDAEQEQYRKLGAIGVIVKPFDPMKLSTQIEQFTHGQ